MTDITVRIRVDATGGGPFLAPMGLATPHTRPTHFEVDGGRIGSVIAEAGSDQKAALIDPTGQEMTLIYRFAEGGDPYPESLFAQRDTPFTRAEESLKEKARDIAAAAGGGRAGLQAIVDHVAGLFRYGHPETRFTDGYDHIPELCNIAEGSCSDINSYLIANLHAAGYEAGYLTGYFFPAEKRGTCNDMHCWVATRCDGVTEEWDIAHHMKAGLPEIRAGLNPKPGFRVAVFHSLGVSFPAIGGDVMKLLAPPIGLDPVKGPYLPDHWITLAPSELLAEAV